MPKKGATAGPIIRKMYNYLHARGLLSAQSDSIMREYFTRTSKLRSGKGKRKSRKASAI